jgi:hypothetical protein
MGSAGATTAVPSSAHPRRVVGMKRRSQSATGPGSGVRRVLAITASLKPGEGANRGSSESAAKSA